MDMPELMIQDDKKKVVHEINQDRDGGKKPIDKRPVCGIIMPISAIGDYSSDHWILVKSVIEKSIEAAGYRPRLVSESEAIGVILAEIVQNIYSDDIVVCDVSAKNPNVMFELGLRLAFDKPVVIIKDDKTDYSFDTSQIKHIPYRYDLRFDDVEMLQKNISAAITASLGAASSNKDYSPFLRHFGKITPRKLNTEEVDSSEYIIQRINRLEDIILSSTKNQNTKSQFSSASSRYMPTVKSESIKIEEIFDYAKEKYGVDVAKLPKGESEEFIVKIVSDLVARNRLRDNGNLA
jgi:hypothetical protein